MVRHWRLCAPGAVHARQFRPQHSLWATPETLGRVALQEFSIEGILAITIPGRELQRHEYADVRKPQQRARECLVWKDHQHAGNAAAGPIRIKDVVLEKR